MAGNRPEMLAAHYAIPAAGAVYNSINTRLNSETVGWILQHPKSKLLLCDKHCAENAKKAAECVGILIQVFSENGSVGLDIIHGSEIVFTNLSEQIKAEWAPIAFNYTSGTTVNQKGVVLHHRGAYLNSLGNILALGFGRSTKYLWTLSMFDCNGWCHTWAITAAGGTHVCLARIDPVLIVQCIQKIRQLPISLLPSGPLLVVRAICH